MTITAKAIITGSASFSELNYDNRESTALLAVKAMAASLYSGGRRPDAGREGELQLRGLWSAALNACGMHEDYADALCEKAVDWASAR